jgi:hypothetical protein
LLLYSVVRDWTKAMDQSTASSRFLDLLLPQWHQQIQSWAQDGSIRRAAQEALLLEGEPARLAGLVNQWAQGDFSALPPIVLLEGSAIPGAAGAYAISPGTIYLSQDWLQTAGDERVLAVLTEELGHHLDGLLNPSDTPGDEGELFAALLNGSGPSSEEHRPAVLAENDHATVRVAGAPVAAEQAAIMLRTPVPQAAPGRTRHEWQNSMAFAALRSDGSVVTWGHHTNGGDSSGVDFDGPANNLRVTRIIPNSRGAFATLRSDGSVVAWGGGIVKR